jgi:hypothetical protein
MMSYHTSDTAEEYEFCLANLPQETPSNRLDRLTVFCLHNNIIHEAQLITLIKNPKPIDLIEPNSKLVNWKFNTVLAVAFKAVETSLKQNILNSDKLQPVFKALEKVAAPPYSLIPLITELQKIKDEPTRLEFAAIFVTSYLRILFNPENTLIRTSEDANPPKSEEKERAIKHLEVQVREILNEPTMQNTKTAEEFETKNSNAVAELTLPTTPLLIELYAAALNNPEEKTFQHPEFTLFEDNDSVNNFIELIHTTFADKNKHKEAALLLCRFFVGIGCIQQAAWILDELERSSPKKLPLLAYKRQQLNDNGPEILKQKNHLKLYALQKDKLHFAARWKESKIFLQNLLKNHQKIKDVLAIFQAKPCGEQSLQELKKILKGSSLETIGLVLCEYIKVYSSKQLNFKTQYEPTIALPSTIASNSTAPKVRQKIPRSGRGASSFRKTLSRLKNTEATSSVATINHIPEEKDNSPFETEAPAMTPDLPIADPAPSATTIESSSPKVLHERKPELRPFTESKALPQTLSLMPAERKFSFATLEFPLPYDEKNLLGITLSSEIVKIQKEAFDCMANNNFRNARLLFESLSGYLTVLITRYSDEATVAPLKQYRYYVSLWKAKAIFLYIQDDNLNDMTLGKLSHDEQLFLTDRAMIIESCLDYVTDGLTPIICLIQIEKLKTNLKLPLHEDALTHFEFVLNFYSQQPIFHSFLSIQQRKALYQEYADTLKFYGKSNWTEWEEKAKQQTIITSLKDFFEPFLTSTAIEKLNTFFAAARALGANIYFKGSMHAHWLLRHFNYQPNFTPNDLDMVIDLQGVTYEGQEKIYALIRSLLIIIKPSNETHKPQPFFNIDGHLEGFLCNLCLIKTGYKKTYDPITITNCQSEIINTGLQFHAHNYPQLAEDLQRRQFSISMVPEEKTHARPATCVLARTFKYYRYLVDQTGMLPIAAVMDLSNPSWIASTLFNSSEIMFLELETLCRTAHAYIHSLKEPERATALTKMTQNHPGALFPSLHVFVQLHTKKESGELRNEATNRLIMKIMMLPSYTKLFSGQTDLAIIQMLTLSIQEARAHLTSSPENTSSTNLSMADYASCAPASFFTSSRIGVQRTTTHVESVTHTNTAATFS